MKKQKQALAVEENPQITRVVRMLRRIQPWLQNRRARVPTFAEMGKWSSVPENTIRGWFAGQGNPTAEFLLSLLERAPEKVRLDILGEFCRDYPTLDHPRLGEDRTLISRLITLLGQPNGFTYIQGSAEEARTFVITALGHSFGMISQPSQRILGLDVHAADWFIPVSGVVYLNNLLCRDELLRAVRAGWPALRNEETPLVMFNGLWSALPELQKEIRELANRCHVLVADEFAVDVHQPARRLPARTNLITVTAAVPRSKSINIEIRAL